MTFPNFSKNMITMSIFSSTGYFEIFGMLVCIFTGNFKIIDKNTFG